MKGGAIPLLVWGAFLAVLGGLNWIWTGDAIQVGTFGFAILVVIVGAGALVLLSRDALGRGAPEPRSDPEAVPDVSVGAVLAGLSVGSILFGLVFGTFFVYFGAGMLLASLGRLAFEVRSQRRSERSVEEVQP
ncbi:MAG TPA: hypothetical protein VG186_10595 [Solirubrobacteraceae bacterium]|jgi:Na+/H+-translocating membrane pyrophosphatase|nr:hypothetical protein [Solirubrobacteraceae bacterium]